MLATSRQAESQKCPPAHLVSVVAAKTRGAIIRIDDAPIFQRVKAERGAVISYLAGNHGIAGPRQVGRERSTGTPAPAFRTPSAQKDGHHDNVRSEATGPVRNGVPSDPA